MLLAPFLWIFCEFDEKVLDNLSLEYRDCGNCRKTIGSAENIRKIQGCHYGMETRNYGS